MTSAETVNLRPGDTLTLNRSISWKLEDVGLYDIKFFVVGSLFFEASKFFSRYSEVDFIVRYFQSSDPSTNQITYSISITYPEQKNDESRNKSWISRWLLLFFGGSK